MTNLSTNTLKYLRRFTGYLTKRPLAALLLVNKAYPDTSITYSVTVGASTITLSNGTSSFQVTYSSKSIQQVAQELSNSPFPIDIIALANIQQLSASELVASGTVIATGFDNEDVTNDGRGAIIRCTRYAIQYDNITALNLKAPYLTNATLPWWPRITNGNFSQRYNGVIYHFSIPEYVDQIWSTTAGKPYIDVEGELTNFVNGHTIKLNRSPVLFKNNIVLTSTVGDKVFSSSVIKDVDTINGILYLNPEVVLPKDVFVYYTYYEQSLLYKGINLNAHFSQNPYLLNKYVVFYALPTKSSSGINRSRAIYHSIGSSIDDAIYAISVDNADEPLCIIGAINIQASTTADSVSIVDTRTFGGGLREDELGKATEKKYKESQYFFDIGHKEGIPYPGTAALVVELPPALKEVLSISEIRERTKRFIAAGVYPIIKTQDEEYFDQFTCNSYNADVSLVDYDFSFANTGDSQSVYGLTGQASYILNTSFSIPTGLYTANYSVTGQRPNPIYEGGVLKLLPGDQFKVTFLKGSADATFSYEQRVQNGSWERVTVSNTRPIPTGCLSCQSFILDASYGYKEIRNITGFSAYIPDTDFVEDGLTSTAKIIEGARKLSNGLEFTGYIPDVYSSQSNINISTGQISVDPLLEPLLVNYNDMYSHGFYSQTGLSYLTGQMKVFYSGTTGNTFPRPYASGQYGTTYNGQYDALRDLHAYARYINGRINQIHDASSITQAVNMTGSSSWINVNTDIDVSYAYTGMLSVVNKVNTLSPFTGNGLINNDIVTPFYNPYTNVAIPLSGTYSNSDVSPVNNLYLGSRYIKTYGAIYAAQVSPTSGEYTHYVSTPLSFKPRNIALSGIANWTYYLGTYFNNPTYLGTGITNTWLTTYNRVSDLGATYLDSVCNGFDYIYYGNNMWAGWTGYEAKHSPYYDPSNSPFTRLSGDITWSDNIEWPDSSILTAGNSLQRAVNEINTSLDLMAPFVKAAARRGGILQPGYSKAIKYYLWHASHAAKSDPLFTGVYTGHVNTFEEGISAILKGSLNEDGVLIDGGSFQYKFAPFSGRIPNDLIDTCVTAAEYYSLVNDSYNERRWKSITEGLYRTTENLYSLSGGYPYGPYFNSTASGDPGSSVLNGYLQFTRLLDTPLTTEQLMSITGQF
jgi:hypothetical protein